MHRVCKDWMRIERSSGRGLTSLRFKLPATPGHLSWLHCKAKAGCKELIKISVCGKLASQPDSPQLALWISSIFALSSYFPEVEVLALTFAPIVPILESLGNFSRLRHLELIDPINAGPLHSHIAAERLTLTSVTVRHKRWQPYQSLVFSPSAIHDWNIALMTHHCSQNLSALTGTILCLPALNLLLDYEERLSAEDRLLHEELCQS